MNAEEEGVMPSERNAELEKIAKDILAMLMPKFAQKACFTVSTDILEAMIAQHLERAHARGKREAYKDADRCAAKVKTLDQIARKWADWIGGVDLFPEAKAGHKKTEYDAIIGALEELTRIVPERDGNGPADSPQVSTGASEPGGNPNKSSILGSDIDEQFLEMANDAKYQQESVQLVREFERVSDSPTTRRPHWCCYKFKERGVHDKDCVTLDSTSTPSPNPAESELSRVSAERDALKTANDALRTALNEIATEVRKGKTSLVFRIGEIAEQALSGEKA